MERPNELLCWLYIVAARPEFYEYVDSLPAELIPRLMEFADNAPAHPEDAEYPFVIVGSVAFQLPEVAEASAARERLECYWACRRLRQHFFPDRKMPEFEVEKCIGVVEEVGSVDGELVLFGDFQDHLIRKHPAYWRHDGMSRPIRFVEQKWYVTSTNPLFTTYEARELPENGLVLEEESYFPDVVTVGAEIWIDRSAVREVPELVYDEFYERRR